MPDCIYETQLVEGVDFLFDPETGRIKFLSTGALGPTLQYFYQYGGCGVQVQFCCGDDGCVYLVDKIYACDAACYVRDGYDTVFQEGANDYKSGDEKMLKRITVEAEPLPQSTPSPLECDAGFGTQPSCFTWKPIRSLGFECQTEMSAAQHAAAGTRPDDNFHFPTWVRGKYISARFRVRGIGGGGTFSALHKLVKGWGQHDSP